MKLNAISRKYFHYFVNWSYPYRKTTAAQFIVFIRLVAFIAFSCSGRIYATKFPLRGILKGDKGGLIKIVAMRFIAHFPLGEVNL